MIYELYNCDDWRTYESMNVSTRIFLTTDRDKLEHEIERLGHSIEDVINQRIENLNLVVNFES